MKTIINPERLVSVPFSKTRCGVDFYINTGESKDICGVLTEHRTFKTDFFSFYFLRRANGYVLLNFRKIMLRDNMILLLSPHQQQEWHVDERNWTTLSSSSAKTLCARFSQISFSCTACCIITRPTHLHICLQLRKNWPTICTF